MACFFVGIRLQRRNAAFNERSRGHRAAIGENHHVGLILKGNVVIRQMVVLDELPDHLPEALLRALRTSLEKQLGQRDTPRFLLATVLSSNFVHPPFNGLTQTEVIPMQSQNFFVADRVEDPIR